MQLLDSFYIDATMMKFYYFKEYKQHVEQIINIWSVSLLKLLFQLHSGKVIRSQK
jgi:hypothetical protein